MKEVMFAVPEQEYQHFMAQMEKLGFLVYQQNPLEVPAEYQQEILHRISNSKESDFEDWDSVKDSFDLDA